MDLMSLLIRNATVVLPDRTDRLDVLVRDGKIVGIGAPRTVTANEVIDASGLHLFPGVIDDQVHFREPGLTHKEDLATASRACAAVASPRSWKCPTPSRQQRRSSGCATNNNSVLRSRSSTIRSTLVPPPITWPRCATRPAIRHRNQDLHRQQHW